MIRLTAIGSGKGGTGKTLTATALSSSLSHNGERVLLFDADLGLSNSTIHLGLESGGDLYSVIAGRVSLDEAVVPVSGGREQPGGFDLIAAPAGSGALANLDAEQAERFVAKLRGAKSYDRVIMDLSAGVDATTMRFATHADETLLVLTPDPAALTDAYAFVKLLLRAGGRKAKVVVNMAESNAEASRTNEALTKTCGAFLKSAPSYLGMVPRDHHVTMAIRQQRSLVALFPQAPSSKAFENIASRLGFCGPRSLTFSAAQSVR
jgi:flagellar biosynthesis protein FlhG